MSRFKAGDKVVWKDKQYAKDWFRNTIDSVMTVVGYNFYQDDESCLLITDNGVEAYNFRFELYKEKEMQEFDKSKLTTGMRVVHENGEVGIILKDIGVIAYKDGFNMIEDFNSDDDLEQATAWKLNKVYKGYQANSKVLDHSRLGELIWERKEEETEQQKRIRELKATIDNAIKQLEELTKETK